MYDRILLPTDGSQANDRAVDEGLELAASTGAELHVLFVVEDIPYAQEAMADEVTNRLEVIGESALEAIRDRATARDISIVTEIRRGAPHSAILTYVDEADIELVVMSTHGRSGLDRYLLGSVTERVIRTSPIPVLTVRKDDES